MSKSILYAVLNWGLGHATRSVPVIKALLTQNNKVIIASDGDALTLLQKEFEGQFFIKLPAYNANYTKNKLFFNLNIVKQIPHLLSTISQENLATDAICKKYNIDVIISDNRYGVYNQNVHSIFLSHQLHLYFPQNKLIEKTANYLHLKKIENFQELWIPDFEPPNNLSGILSKIKFKNQKHIGLLSRMQPMQTNQVFDCCVVLSGPEPQRTVLEQILLRKCQTTHLKIAFVRGVFTEENPNISFKNQESQVFNYCHTEQLNQLIYASNWVVCRSGYSSVMDLVALQKKAVLIPTPGLPEQNYLAQYLKENGWFYSVEQENFDFESVQDLLENYVPPSNIGYGLDSEVFSLTSIPQ